MTERMSMQQSNFYYSCTNSSKGSLHVISLYIRTVEKQSMTSSIASRIKNVSRGGRGFIVKVLRASLPVKIT